MRSRTSEFWRKLSILLPLAGTFACGTNATGANGGTQDASTENAGFDAGAGEVADGGGGGERDTGTGTTNDGAVVSDSGASGDSAAADAGKSGDDGGGAVTGFPTVSVFDADLCHDLDVAAGPSLIATATNAGHVAFYKKDGTKDHVSDLAGSCGDQHIQWDDASQRWFLSVMNCDTTVFVYATTDATGKTWTQAFTATLTGSLDDVQLAVTTDKVLLVNADCIFPLDKTAVMAGGGSASPTGSCGIKQQEQVWGTHSGHPQPSTAYFCTMSDDQHLNWVSVDGTGTNITVKQHEVAISNFTTFPVSPGVPQPPGSAHTSGSSLRASGAEGMWHGGELWCSFVETCGNLSCQRMFHVHTDTTTESDFEFSATGAYVWSAAPGIDAHGNMWSVMSESSATLDPSVAVGGFSAAGATTPPKIVFQGTQPDESNGNPDGTFLDWGDFFACDQDPSDGSVWCVANYGGAPVNGCGTPAKLVHVQTK